MNNMKKMALLLLLAAAGNGASAQNKGHYWSSTQASAGSGRRLNFNNVTNYTDNNNKAFGFAIRCVQGL